MAVLVIGAALLVVRKHLVSLFRFFELLFGFWIVRVTVRVMLHRKLAISLFNFFFRSISVDAKYFVIISFCHYSVAYKVGLKMQESTSKFLTRMCLILTNKKDYFLSDLTSSNSASTTSASTVFSA